MDIQGFKKIVTDASEKAILTIQDRLEAGDLDENALYKMSNSICSLSRAVSEAERGARTKASMLGQIREEFRDLVKSTLARDPELCARIFEIGDQAFTTLNNGQPLIEEKTPDE